MRIFDLLVCNNFSLSMCVLYSSICWSQNPFGSVVCNNHYICLSSYVLFVWTPSERKKVGIPLGILPDVWEQKNVPTSLTVRCKEIRLFGIFLYKTVIFTSLKIILKLGKTCHSHLIFTYQYQSVSEIFLVAKFSVVKKLQAFLKSKV